MKKLLVMLLTLVATFSVAYTYYNFQMQAASYNIGGRVYGQMGPPTIGDRIYLGTKNNFNQPMGWVLLAAYDNGHYLAGSTSLLDKTTFFLKPEDIPVYFQQTDYSKSGLWASLNSFNARLKGNSRDMQFVAPRTVTWHNSLFADESVKAAINNPTYGWEAAKSYEGKLYKSSSHFGAADYKKAYGVARYIESTANEFYGVSGSINAGYTGQKVAYVTSFNTLTENAASYCIKATFSTCPWGTGTAPTLAALPYTPANELIMLDGKSQVYLVSHIGIWDEIVDSRGSNNRYAILVDTISDIAGDNPKIKFGTEANPVIGDASGVRPHIELDQSAINEKVLFSLSQPIEQGNGVVGINEPVKTMVYYGSDENMKMRVYNAEIKAEFEDILFQEQSVTKNASAGIRLPLNDTVQLQVDANAGSYSYGTNTISALLFDDAGELIAYAPIATAKNGSNKYDLDMSKFNLTENATYTIKIVNEKYSTDLEQVTPADCSSISSGFTFKAVSSLVLTYTPTYNASVAGSEPYEYNNNVKVDDIVGTITSSNGDSNYSMSLVTAPAYKDDVDHKDDYTNFYLPQTGIPAKDAPVKVKSGGPDVDSKGLKAGTYYFRIQGYAPSGNAEPYAVVDVELTVKKTTPTVAFATLDQTKIKIGDTTGIDELITTDNTEITHAGGAYAPSYGLSGGVDGTGLSATASPTNAKGFHLSIGESTTAILPATFKLKVTLPETKNYTSVTSEAKEVFVYKGLSALSFTPTKLNGFQLSEVTSDQVIGHLLAQDGLPSYTYALTKSTDTGYDAEAAKDNGSFTVANTPLAVNKKAEVKTNTALQAKTYYLQFIVTDQAGNTFTTNGEIKVLASAQSALNFVEDGETITSKSIYFGTDSKILAQGGSADTDVTYALVDEADADYVGITTNADGTATLTPVKITEASKTVKIKATKPGDANYAEVTAELLVTILPAKQTVAFTDATSDAKKIRLDETNVTLTAHGYLTSNGTIDSGHGSITYSSSNEAVAKVDASTGKITPVKSGASVDITATLNGVGSADYDANYETATTIQKVYIYDAMSITWNPVTPNLIASKTANANEKVGAFAVTDNNGQVKYAPVTDTNVAENVDGAMFSVDALGNVKLKEDIIVSDYVTHGNPYKVQIKISDDYDTQIMSLEINIDPAENNFYFIDPDTMKKIEKLEKPFVSDGTFTLATHTSNSGAVTYSLKDQANDVITVAENGTVQIKKTGTAVVQATVAEASGYATKTIEMPITITKAELSLVWEKPQTTYQKYNESVSVSEKAILTPPTTLKYEPLTPTICEIDVEGMVTALQAGTCEIKATGSGANFDEKSITKKVIFFTGASGEFEQTNVPQAGSAPINTSVGIVTLQGDETDKYHFTIHTKETLANVDHALFKVDVNYGTVSLNQLIDLDAIKDKVYDKEKGGYPFLVQVVAEHELSHDQLIIDCVIYVKGLKMNDVAFKGDDGRPTNKIVKVYQEGGTFTVDLVNNKGGTPKYSFKSGPQDVINPQLRGNMVSILHANEKGNLNQAVIQAEIPAENGYEAATVTCVVEITQAEQDEFRFADTELQMLPNSRLDVTVTGTKTEGPTTLKSDDKSIVAVEGMTLVSKEKEAATTITATHKGNRDYKDGHAQIPVEVTNAPAYPFVIDVDDAMYGDDPYDARVTQSSPSADAEITRQWFSSDESVATIDSQTGTITIIGAGSTTISCVQTSSIDPEVRDHVVLNVAKKPINVTIEDVEKKVGEAVPSFHAIIDTAELVGNDELPQPIFTCADNQGQLVDAMSKAGPYTIDGSYEEALYKNYAITVVPGTLLITQDPSNDTWYELIGNDTTELIPSGTWVKEDVLVKLKKTESVPYDTISLDQVTWAEQILMDQEGTQESDVHFQKSDTHALATNQHTVIKIDKTVPTISSITGEQVEQNEISKLLNQLTFGHYFRPQDEITIQANDIKPAGVNEISGLQEVTYTIYELDRETGLPIDPTIPYEEQTITMNMETIKFNVDDIGIYRICAIASDHAGNESARKCADINVKKIDVNGDDDPAPDFNDSNTDGCPDLNIVLGTDKAGNKVKLNVAEENKKYPYMNIDSDGDGKADLNIDTDHDGKPDLNLTQMSEELWKQPTICVSENLLSDYSEPIEYCTGTKAKASINIDLTGNLVPDVNIDTKGDFKPHYNIVREEDLKKDAKDIKPYLNIGPVHTVWKPSHDYKVGTMIYDTCGDEKPLLNIDSDGDGFPDLNIDFAGDGVAELNIDLDGNGIPELNIDGDGDGIPDYNLDADENGIPTREVIQLGVWKPNKNGKKDGVSFDTMSLIGKEELEDQGVKIEIPNGKFLPNHALKVTDVSDQEKDQIIKDAQINEDQKVDVVYQLELSDGITSVQPEETIKVKLPVRKKLKNPNLLVEQSDGSWKKIPVKVEGDYYVYETDYLGKVTVVSDLDELVVPPKPDDPTVVDPINPKPDDSANPTPVDPTKPTPIDPTKPTPIEPGTSSDSQTPNPKPSVQGSYTAGTQSGNINTQPSTNGGIGGALTSDVTDLMLISEWMIASILLCCFMVYKKRSRLFHIRKERR